MPFKNKRKGSDFERQAVEILNNLVVDSEWKRIPGSGALGTALGEPLLTSDIVGKVKSLSKRFKVEAKVGYNPPRVQEVKQFLLKKEWLDKVKMEADASYSIPFLIGKFSGARDGTKVFVVTDVEIFAFLINHITKLQDELDKLGVANDRLLGTIKDVL